MKRVDRRRAREDGSGGGGENPYRDKEGFYEPICTLRIVLSEGIAEKYWRTNYGSLLFIPLSAHLLLPRLSYPIYFEVLSVLSAEQISKLSAPLQADGRRGAIFQGTSVPQLLSSWVLRMVALL